MTAELQQFKGRKMAAKYTEDPGQDSSPLLNEIPSERIASETDISVQRPGRIATRYVLVIYGFFGFLNVYMMRVNLNVAIVAMANSTADNSSDPDVVSDCPADPSIINQTQPKTHPSAKTFDWDENLQGQILGAFYYGYMVTQIPGGWLAGKFGGKWIFGLGILSTSILTLLTPVTILYGGATWFIVLRVLEGFCEGVTFPTMYAIMAKWAPPFERTKMLMFAMSGADFGTIVATPVAGILCDSNFMQGWPSVFYIFGVLGIIWFIMWSLFIHDSPSKHPRIAQEERDYIEKSIGFKAKTTLKVPVLSIITSPAVWAIAIAHICTSYGNNTLLIDLPTYFKNFLRFDVSQSGILSSLPAILRWITYVLSAFLADVFREKGYLSTGATRKLFNSIGTVIPALSLAMVAFVGCSKVWGVIFLCISSLGFGSVTAGYNVNHLDIAPRYAGFLMGFTNMGGQMTGFLVPIIMGSLTNNNNTKISWQIIFWICSGLLTIGFFTYLILGSGEEQSWAKLPPDMEDDTTDKDSSRRDKKKE